MCSGGRGEPGRKRSPSCVLETPYNGAIKEGLPSQGIEATGRGWLACLEMAPFRAWTGGPGTARNQLHVLRGPLPSLGNGN